MQEAVYHVDIGYYDDNGKFIGNEHRWLTDDEMFEVATSTHVVYWYLNSSPRPDWDK